MPPLPRRRTCGSTDPQDPRKQSECGVCATSVNEQLPTVIGGGEREDGVGVPGYCEPASRCRSTRTPGPVVADAFVRFPDSRPRGRFFGGSAGGPKGTGEGAEAASGPFAA